MFFLKSSSKCNIWFWVYWCFTCLMTFAVVGTAKWMYCYQTGSFCELYHIQAMYLYNYLFAGSCPPACLFCSLMEQSLDRATLTDLSLHWFQLLHSNALILKLSICFQWLQSNLLSLNEQANTVFLVRNHRFILKR